MTHQAVQISCVCVEYIPLVCFRRCVFICRRIVKLNLPFNLRSQVCNFLNMVLRTGPRGVIVPKANKARLGQPASNSYKIRIEDLSSKEGRFHVHVSLFSEHAHPPFSRYCITSKLT